MKYFTSNPLILLALLWVPFVVALPLYAQPPEKVYAPAQKLVDEAVKNHPDLLVIAMHVTPPGGRDNVIIASRFAVKGGSPQIQRIGKKADEDDLRVIKTGKPNLEINKAGDRFEVEMPLQDSAGKTIGALSTVFAYMKGDNVSDFEKRGLRIQNELRKKIPSLESLFHTSP